MVVKDVLLEAHDWLAEELFTLFKTAKDHALNQPNLQDAALNELKSIIGDDPLLYGIEPNRDTIKSFIQFNVEQGVIPESVTVDDLFPSSILSLV